MLTPDRDTTHHTKITASIMAVGTLKAIFSESSYVFFPQNTSIKENIVKHIIIIYMLKEKSAKCNTFRAYQNSGRLNPSTNALAGAVHSVLTILSNI